MTFEELTRKISRGGIIPRYQTTIQSHLYRDLNRDLHLNRDAEVASSTPRQPFLEIRFKASFAFFYPEKVMMIMMVSRG